jgi:hypothetical protein
MLEVWAGFNYGLPTVTDVVPYKIRSLVKYYNMRVIKPT